MSRLLASIPLRDLLSLDAGGFADLFRNSPLKRIKREGLLRNGCIVLGNAGAPDDIDFLKALSGESPPGGGTCFLGGGTHPAPPRAPCMFKRRKRLKIEKMTFCSCQNLNLWYPSCPKQ